MDRAMIFWHVQGDVCWQGQGDGFCMDTARVFGADKRGFWHEHGGNLVALRPNQIYCYFSGAEASLGDSIYILVTWQ